MQVEVERLPNSRARLTVTVPVEDVTAAMDKAFKTLVKRYDIPGFRRGKAPRAVFERYAGKEMLLREASEQLVEQTYPEALSQSGLVAVDRPTVDITGLGLGEPMTFTAEVQVKPDIDLGNYQELLNEPLQVPEVTDGLLDEELNRVADSEAHLVAASEEDPVEAGSRVVLDLKGVKEGETEPFVEAPDYSLELGRGSTVEGLEAQLVGLHLNEHATLRFTYPEDYPDPTLQRQPVVFEVTVKEHKKKEIPPIDDELAVAKGKADLQELRESLTNSVRERLEREAKEARLQGILGRLKETVVFEVPDALVGRAIARQLQDLEHNLSHLGADLQQYLDSRGITIEALAEEMRPGAVERVKDQLLLEALANREGLTVSDEEVLEAVRSVADAYQRPISTLVENLKVSGDFEAVRDNLLMDKAAEFVREVRSA